MLRAAFRRFLPFVCLASALVSPAFARVRFWGYAEQGGKVVLTGGVSSSLPKLQGSYPQSTVTVTYTGGAAGRVSTSGTAVTWLSGTPFNANGQWSALLMTINAVQYTVTSCASTTACTLSSSAGTQTNVTYSMPSSAPAAIFSDNAGTAKSDPFTSDTSGYYFFYADDGTYTLTFSGTGVSTPFSYAADSGLDPFVTATGGVPTLLRNALLYCPFDVMYSSFAVAVANIPSYGCLNVISAQTVSSAITVTRSNVTINITSVGSISHGSSNLSVLIISGTAITINCTGGGGFDGRFSQSGYTNATAITTTGTNTSVTGCLFNNFSGIVILGNSGPVNLIVSRNTFTAIAGNDCIELNNPVNYLISDNYANGVTTGDFLHAFANASSPLASGITQNNRIYNESRMAIELQGVWWIGAKDIGNTGTGIAGTAISSGFSQGSTVFKYRQIINNSFTGANGASYCIEEFTDNAQIIGNECDNFGVGLEFAGSGKYVAGNVFSNMTGGGIAINPNPEAPLNTVITGNRFVNNKTSDVYLNGAGADAGGTIIRDNTHIRQPGAFVDDATNTWLASGCSGTTACTIDNENITITAASGAFPTGFVAIAFASAIGSPGRVFSNNKVVNQNTALFGYAFEDFTGTSYANNIITGNQFVNLSAIDQGNGARTSSGTIVFSGNTSTCNIVACTPATAWLITPVLNANLIYGKLGNPNICSDCYGSPAGSLCVGGGSGTNITAVNLGGHPMCYGAPGMTSSPTAGSLGANVTSVTTTPGDQYNFVVTMVVGGTISSVEKLATLTFSPGFLAQPNFCTISSLGVVNGPAPVGIQGTSATTVDLYGGVPTIGAGSYFYSVRCP